MNKQPLPIGFPKNSQLRKDLAPVEELLQLRECADGNLRTNLISEAVFRPLRVQDIVQFIDRFHFQIGFVGEDVLAEYLRPGQRNLETAPLNVGEPVKLCLLVREEERSQVDALLGSSDPQANLWRSMPFVNRNGTAAPRSTYDLALLTAYPNITARALATQYDYEELDGNTTIRRALPPTNILQSLNQRLDEQLKPLEMAGQIESILRNRDVWNAVGAVDLVRTGASAARFDLAPCGEPLMTSRPALTRLISPTPNPRVDDIFARIRELIAPCILE